MEPKLQPIEIEAARRRDDDLAIDHASVRQRGKKPAVQLGEVAVERLQVATLDVDVPAAAEDDRAKPVPLGFENEIPRTRDLFRDFRQHRFHRWSDRKCRHDPIKAVPLIYAAFPPARRYRL